MLSMAGVEKVGGSFYIFYWRIVLRKTSIYCRMRGIAKIAEQCLLTAAIQNMKKIAMALFFLLFQNLNPPFVR